MKTKCILIFAWLMAVWMASAQPLPPTTAFTRSLLRASTAAEARSALGVNSSGGTNGLGTAEVNALIEAGTAANALHATAADTATAASTADNAVAANIASDIDLTGGSSNKVKSVVAVSPAASAADIDLSGGSSNKIKIVIQQNTLRSSNVVNNSMVAIDALGAVTSTFDGKPLTNVNAVSITLYPNGTNDSTITQSNALRNGGTIVMAPGDYYTSNTLYFTNHTILIARGVTNHFAINSTGFALKWNTNVSDVQIEGLTLDGGWSAIDFRHRGDGLTNFLATGIQPIITGFGPFTNHSGFFINQGGGGEVRNIQAYGFTGIGCFVVDTNDSNAFQTPKTCFAGINSMHDNYVGLWPDSWSFDGVGEGSTTPSFQQSAEYMSQSTFYCTRNSIGIALGVSNHNMNGVRVTGNFYGILLQPGSNNGTHGVISGCTFNHNFYSLVANSWNSGELIQDNVFLAGLSGNSKIWLQNVNGFEWKNNRMSGETITITNIAAGIPNFFINNSYQGRWGIDFIINGEGINQVTNWAWGNYSTTIPGDTDGWELFDRQVSKIAFTQTNSQTTMFDDPELSITNVPANRPLEIIVDLLFRSGNNTPGFNEALVIPTPVVGKATIFCNHTAGDFSAATGFQFEYGEAGWSTTGASATDAANTGVATSFRVQQKCLTTLSTSGTVKVKWAQFSSQATFLTNCVGSTLRVRELRTVALPF